MSVSIGPAVDATPSRSAAPRGSSDSPRSGAARSSPRNNDEAESNGQRNSKQQRDPSSSPESARSDGSSGSGSGHHRSHGHGARVERSSPSDGFDGQFAVEVKGVTLGFGGKKGKTILNKLDLSIEQGTIYGLLGPSGCGQCAGPNTKHSALRANSDNSAGISAHSVAAVLHVAAHRVRSQRIAVLHLGVCLSLMRCGRLWLLWKFARCCRAQHHCAASVADSH